MDLEEDYLPISALQHLVFCPRQCALIYVERIWDENLLTTLGKLEHERIDIGYSEFRRGKRQFSGLFIKSNLLKLQGRLDVLELDVIDPGGADNLSSFRVKGSWKVAPVEFKHGEPKESDCDRVQLCAQVICLEEMLGVKIEEASLFYWRIRRREEVKITDILRQKTQQAAQMLHELFKKALTPPPIYRSQCRSCSLMDNCFPKKIGHRNEYRKIIFTPQEFE